MIIVMMKRIRLVGYVLQLAAHVYNIVKNQNLQGEDEDRKQEGKSKCEIFRAVLRYV